MARGPPASRCRWCAGRTGEPRGCSRSDEVSQVSSSAGQQSTPYKWVTLGRVFRLGRSLARAPHSPARPWLRAEQPFGSTTSNKASIAPAASSPRKTESLLLPRGSSQRCPGVLRVTALPRPCVCWDLPGRARSVGQAGAQRGRTEQCWRRGRSPRVRAVVGGAQGKPVLGRCSGLQLRGASGGTGPGRSWVRCGCFICPSRWSAGPGTGRGAERAAASGCLQGRAGTRKALLLGASSGSAPPDPPRCSQATWGEVWSLCTKAPPN